MPSHGLEPREPTDYKSVALPIEPRGLEELNKIKHYIPQVKYALLANEDEC